MSEAPLQSARTAAYEADPAEVRRVLLLYSGGLDTSVMLKWIQDRYEAEVVCLTVNLGQPGEDYAVIEDKARRLGALECHVIDARERFANDFVAPAIRANALYGGGYPLFTALGRPLIAELAVEQARASGCDTIAHGCTGKGNDQVRIEGTIAALAPELKILAPVRDWKMGREEEIQYARDNGIPIKGGTEAPPYSIDDNIWGRSSEGRVIEDLSEPARRDVFQLITPPEEAPDEPAEVTVGFEAGVPVSLNGSPIGLVELIETAAAIGCRNGVGFVDHIEDLSEPARRDVFQLITPPEEAPDEPEEVTVGFEAGVPVSLNGDRLGLVELIEAAAEIGCRNGVGFVDHIEDRIVGLKVRDLYEVPAAAILLPAHRELEKLVSTRHQNLFKPQLENQWAFMVYAGLWQEPLLGDINAYMDRANEMVTGEITLKLYKGNVTPIRRSSPNALYDSALASFTESGGLFSQQASPGFIELWTLQSRMAYEIRNREKEER
jgi:argininosuccinate synthase